MGDEDHFSRMDVAKLDAIIDGLDAAFDWKETREGYGAWCKVFMRLKGIRTEWRKRNQHRWMCHADLFGEESVPEKKKRVRA